MSAIGGPSGGLGGGFGEALMGKGAGGDGLDGGPRDRAQADIGPRDPAGRRLGLIVADLAEAGRADLFARSLRQAARALEEDDAPADDTAGAARLLALSQGFVSTGLPSPAEAAPSAALPPRGEAIVADIQTRVDQALRTEARMESGRPIQVQVDLAGAVAGLKGISLALTPTGLDVVLLRSTDTLPPELVSAAAALADRLRFRFARQTVRILEREAAGSAPQQEGQGS